MTADGFNPFVPVHYSIASDAGECDVAEIPVDVARDALSDRHVEGASAAVGAPRAVAAVRKRVELEEELADWIRARTALVGINAGSTSLVFYDDAVARLQAQIAALQHGCG